MDHVKFALRLLVALSFIALAVFGLESRMGFVVRD
jgi:hypothetical protein